MAVRNLEGIIRNGNMVAEEKANAKRLRTENLNNRIDKIRAIRVKCIDAVDTIIALNNNGLGQKFSDWQKDKDIHFNFQYRAFQLGNRSEGEVEYRPYTDSVEFDWCGHGMMEHYSTANTNPDYLVYQVMEVGNRRAYNKNLTALATKLEPFIDAFFAWVDTLS